MNALNLNVFSGLSNEEKTVFGKTVLVSDFNDLFMAEAKYKERLQDQSLTAEEKNRYKNLLQTVRKIQDRRIELTAEFLSLPRIIVSSDVKDAIEKSTTTVVTEKKESVGGNHVS